MGEATASTAQQGTQRRARQRGRGMRTPLFAVLALLAMVGTTSLLSVAPASAVPVDSETVVLQILADTNAVRAQAGLPPLVRNRAMESVAMNWSLQQATANVMSHNPDYTRQIPAGWTRAGENVAMGYQYTDVVTGWANSPGHLANLDGPYTDIGIGYAEVNGHRYYTQDFAKYATTVVPTPTPTPTPTAPPQPAAAPSSPAPVPVVSGNLILDARDGSTFVPHAVNWPSFEYACQQGWDYAGPDRTAAAAAAMASWHINMVRIPLNEACWLGGTPTDYGTAAGYKAALKAWVDLLNAAGIAVILDLHWSAPTGYAADGQRAMPDSRSVTFWSQVATAYATSPSVLFEAFNEPYSRWNDATNSWAFTLSWSCWKNGGCQAPVVNDSTPINGATYTTVGMSAIVSAIRAAGAAQPVLLGGIDYSNDLRGWIANKPSDSQLIAAWHNYPGQRCQTASCWNSEIAPVAAQVPVMATEFGETDGGSSFLTTFMNWADAHGIGYAPWAWWQVDISENHDAALYALIADSNFTPKAPSGTTYHDHLAGLSTPTAPVAPATPTAQPSATGLDVHWAAPASGGSAITGYSIEVTGTTSYTATTTGTTASIAGVVPGVYSIRVRANNTVGPGAWSPTLSFSMPGSFADVTVDNPFFADIQWMYDTGLSTGSAGPNGRPIFSPSDLVSRQAMAAFLYRQSGQSFVPPSTPSFSDVPTSNPFFTAIEWMKAQNITAGYSDGTFHPADTVTRMAMAAFLQRDALETAWTPPATPSFSDVPVGAPFYASIEWMRYAAITNGFADGSYHPADPVTRQAMAAFLHRLATHLAG